ncbi:T9SS type B sorting domain-containing protein [Flavivirga eckloniae]|uniref:T9SS type B sorting domain-containing protein n=1 Tax=Flavivirga eckloniae TaxID=1803846 RepID=A0A2K9PVF4_9FLAO|nr:T9SS type B sorting domain-containing protein [Flavivirga eckloniae]AUP81050.1 hypothetical protein C1H87_20965 [Flavivirga eckloniae]
MKKTTLLILSLIISCNAFCQKEASNWYFGENAGIRFNVDGSISELTDGRLNTLEGCTTISDANGNLLFYTDGITVWDKSHTPMSNANQAIGNGLFGNPSSTQSAIVIPKPKDPNIYYIFTVDTFFGDNIDNGFNYSIVDMTLNGGFGDVTSKNINLLAKSSEKISAVVKDCKTQSLWVITLAPPTGLLTDPIVYNTFYAYEITENGINTTPYVSPFNGLDVTDARGYLKLSPDGTKLVCANSVSGLFLYDFDVTTGMVSNQNEITINFSPVNRPQSPYGVEFSQNGQILYVSAFFNPDQEQFNNPDVQYSSLLQYDLTATDISGSEVVLDERQMFRGGLQLGLDGRIYRAMSVTYNIGSPYLSVINDPNNLGPSCNYEHNAIRLSRNSNQGLPPFISSFFAEKIDIIGNNATSTRLQLCEGDNYRLKADNIPGAIYSWSYNDIPLSDSNYYLDIPTSDGHTSGLYRVFVDLNTGDCSETLEGIATVTFNPNPIAHDAEIIQCDEDGIIGGKTRFDLTQANDDLTGGNPDLATRFFSDNGRNAKIANSDNYEYDADNPGPIYVEVYNTNSNCYNISTLTLNLSTVSIPPFIHNICDELGSEDGINTFNLNDITANIQTTNNFTHPITYYETRSDALLEKNSLNTPYKNENNAYDHTIYARAENNNACFSIIEVVLKINKLPNLDTDDLTYYYCLNKYPKTISINAGIPNGLEGDYTYVWSTGESSYNIPINEAGSYHVTITNTNGFGCSKERTIIVEPSNVATFNPNKPFEVRDASQNNTITVFVSGEGTYQYRLLNENNIVYVPYQDSNVFENIAPGIYTVTVKDVKNNCGITPPKKVSVIGFPKFFTPNNDGKHDTWQIYGVSNMFQPNTKIHIFNRYGRLIKQINPIGEGWDGTVNGNRLPVDDYWFSVQLEDGRVFKNHFTLKY